MIKLNTMAYLLGHNQCLSTNGNINNPFNIHTSLYNSWNERYDEALNYFL